MPDEVLASVNRVFPWLRHLAPEQAEAFYADFFAALEQTLHSKDWSILEAAIDRWQATAAVLADTDLTAILTAVPDNDDIEDWAHVESELFDTSA